MKTIVALVDFSDLTARVADQAAHLARAFSTDLVLLHVVPEQPAVVELGLASPTVLQAPSEQKIAHDYGRLSRLRDSIATSGVPVSAQQLERADVGKVLDQCRSLEADLIVMGTHHHSALYHLFVGSLTSNVLQHATCPVMIVPAPREEKA